MQLLYECYIEDRWKLAFFKLIFPFLDVLIALVIKDLDKQKTNTIKPVEFHEEWRLYRPCNTAIASFTNLIHVV